MNDTKSVALVVREEVRDAWLRGWGPWLMVGVAFALSGVAVGVAYTSQINLLDAREGVAILVRLAIGLGLLFVLFGAADSISGERDRATLESLLLTPVEHSSLVLGKAIAAMAWWLVTFLVATPYVLAVGTGPGGALDALAVVATAGLAMAVFFGFGAVLISARARTNLVSLGLALLAVGVLAVPGLLPAAVTRGPIGQFILRADPVTSSLQLLNRVVVDQHSFASEVTWLASPVIAAVIVVAAVVVGVRTVEIEPGS